MPSPRAGTVRQVGKANRCAAIYFTENPRSFKGSIGARTDETFYSPGAYTRGGTAMNEEILTKIRKVLELARRGGTEGESQAAMLRVQEMLAKYNLEMSEVEDHSLEDKLVFERFPATARRVPTDLIWHGVAQLYFCSLIRDSRSTPPTLVVVGRSSNVAVVRDLARYLVEICERLAQSECEPRERRSFRQGFADRVAMRARKAVREAMSGDLKDSESGTALVVSPLYEKSTVENKSFVLATLGPTTRGRRTRARVDSEAYSKGHRHGEKAPLSAHGIADAHRTKKLSR